MNCFLGHKITVRESATIDALRFVCVVSVVMLHSHVIKYSTAENLELLKSINRIFYVFSPLPVLFLLSGYLFFYNVPERYTLADYWKKQKRRGMSLLLPYMIWNTVGLVVTSFQQGVFVIQSFSDLMNVYWPLDPMGHPEGRAIWFIRNLIFFSLVSPLYYWVVKRLKHGTLLLVAGLYLLKLPVDYLYFNVYLLAGSYLGYYKFSLEKLSKVVDWRVGGAIYLVLMLMDVVGHIDIYFLEFIPFFVIYGALMNFRIKDSLSSMGMFIYVSHLYIAYAITNIYVKLLPYSVGALSLAMLLSCVTTLTICGVAFVTLRKYAPSLLRLLTGGH